MLDFSEPQHTKAITKGEILYIVTLVRSKGIAVEDVFLTTEVDIFGDTYNFFYAKLNFHDLQEVNYIESEFYCLEKLFGITFSSEDSGSGRFGRIYQFAHYFE